MSTRRQSDWGAGDVRGDSPLLGSSPSGASEQLYGLLQNYVRLPGFGKQLVLGRIGDLSGGVNGGIDMNRVNRSMLGPLYGANVGSYTITAANYTEVDPQNLAGKMTCTGRPVIVLMSALVTRSSTLAVLTLSVSMDGAEITGPAVGSSDGMGLVDLNAAPDFNLVNWRIMTPPAGQHRFALVAKVGGSGTGTIWSSPDDVVQLAVVEL